MVSLCVKEYFERDYQHCSGRFNDNLTCSPHVFSIVVPKAINQESLTYRIIVILYYLEFDTILIVRHSLLIDLAFRCFVCTLVNMIYHRGMIMQCLPDCKGY